jgi:DNA-binding CsgD family transcriptional regulator
VVDGIVAGLSYKLVADTMNISIDTVRKYIKSIYRKLHINSKGELIAKYHGKK